MVSYVNVGRCVTVSLPADWSSDAGRKIDTSSPLYAPDEVLSILAKGAIATRLFTTTCAADVANEGWSLRDVGDLLKDAIQNGKFRGSQWCRQGAKGPIAACDAYSITRQVIDGHRTYTAKYYVKFAIAKTGTLLLIFSCHPS